MGFIDGNLVDGREVGTYVGFTVGFAVVGNAVGILLGT